MSSSFAAKLLLILCAANLSLQVDNTSVFGIGRRIAGDQLLMKDIVKTPSITLTEETIIRFNYAIPQPITHIQMLSEENIYVSVDFSYENDLVNGTIRKEVPGVISGLGKNHDPFEVLIQIYGFIETNLHDVDPRYILNRDQEYHGILKPSVPKVPDEQEHHETLNLMHEDSIALEHFDEEEEIDMDEDVDDDEHVFSEDMNKVFELGSRQAGDYLLYETDQSSPETTETPTNHTAVLYYIDSTFITFVKFTIIGHFITNPPLDDYRPPSVAVEKISPHTLKAIVTDQHTTSLFVLMQIYGYEPKDKPVAFQSYLTIDQASATPAFDVSDDDVDDVTIELPLTVKRRTRVHFNAMEEAYTGDGVGQLVIFNWLISTTMTTLTLAMIWRHIVY